jgi:hypothetical protein
VAARVFGAFSVGMACIYFRHCGGNRSFVRWNSQGNFSSNAIWRGSAL